MLEGSDDRSERQIAQVRYLGQRMQKLRVKGIEALLLAKANNPMKKLMNESQEYLEDYFAFVRQDATQVKKQIGTLPQERARVYQQKQQHTIKRHGCIRICPSTKSTGQNLPDWFGVLGAI